MNRSTIIFFFVLLVVVLLIARCNSRSRLSEVRERAKTPEPAMVPAVSPTPSAPLKSSTAPTTQANTKPSVDFEKVAVQVRPAVVLISVFEPSGKLLRTGSGAVVSDDGRIITTRSLMEGASYAVAKMPDGRIDNVTGILADIAPDDLAVVKAESKGHRPFVVPSVTTSMEEGSRIAIIGSPLSRTKTVVFESTISKRRVEGGGEWLEMSTSVPNDVIGAPAINERGEVIGLVTHNRGEPAVVIRPSATMNSVLTRAPAGALGKWFVKETAPSPAEGPLQKVPLAQNPQATKSRLVYSPAPQYPSSVRMSSGMVKGSGRFRLTFSTDGTVKDIAILRSTQNGALDGAAIQALRRWKSTPGEEWTLNVPITFQ